MALIDEFGSSESSTPFVRTVSAIMLILVSLTGSIMNSVNFIAILFRVQKRDGFLKICGLNSFGNIVVCVGYLVFPVPCLLIEGYPNHWLNAFMGQLIGWLGWSIAPLSQILLACNRITAVFFPHLHMRNWKICPTNLGISSSLLFAVFLFFVLLPEDCHYLFERDYLGWIGETSNCTRIAQNIFLVSMTTVAAATTCCSVVLFVKLIVGSPERRVSNVQLHQRHRKNRRMIIQALVQSFLIIVDALNSTITYNMFPNLFFQFITLSFSMVFLRTVEGFVIFSINSTVNAEVKKMFGVKNLVQVTIMVPKRSISAVGHMNHLR